MIPSSCLVFEQEFLQITAGLEGVSGVPARLLITACDAAGLATMNQQIDLASEQLATCDPDVVLYGCTSGSFMDGNAGEQAIVQRISAIVSKPVATLSQAVLAAMKRLALKRVVMLTPYDEPLTRQETDWLGGNGIETVDVHYCDIKENLDRGSQRLADSFERAMSLNWAEADGLFLSCGNVPYLQIIERLETQTGRPVVTSSTAGTWTALRLAGVNEPINGFGRLLATQANGS